MKNLTNPTRIRHNVASSSELISSVKSFATKASLVASLMGCGSNTEINVFVQPPTSDAAPQNSNTVDSGMPSVRDAGLVHDASTATDSGSQTCILTPNNCVTTILPSTVAVSSNSGLGHLTVDRTVATTETDLGDRIVMSVTIDPPLASGSQYFDTHNFLDAPDPLTGAIVRYSLLQVTNVAGSEGNERLIILGIADSSRVLTVGGDMLSVDCIGFQNQGSGPSAQEVMVGMFYQGTQIDTMIGYPGNSFDVNPALSPPIRTRPSRDIFLAYDLSSQLPSLNLVHFNQVITLFEGSPLVDGQFANSITVSFTTPATDSTMISGWNVTTMKGQTVNACD